VYHPRRSTACAAPVARTGNMMWAVCSCSCTCVRVHWALRVVVSVARVRALFSVAAVVALSPAVCPTTVFSTSTRFTSWRPALRLQKCSRTLSACSLPRLRLTACRLRVHLHSCLQSVVFACEIDRCACVCMCASVCVRAYVRADGAQSARQRVPPQGAHPCGDPQKLRALDDPGDQLSWLTCCFGAQRGVDAEGPPIPCEYADRASTRH
jgi:hypothetical protein